MVKDEKRQKDEELRGRIRRLNEEEGAAVKRLNAALAAEADEKKRIAEDLSLARDEGAAAVKKSVLLQEIKALESAKAELLSPIDDKRKEAENLFESARQTTTDIGKRNATLKESEQELLERFEALVDRESEALEKSIEADKREARIQAAEEELKRSNESLGQKWLDYHKESRGLISGIEARESKVAAEMKANNDFRGELERKEANLIPETERLRAEAKKAIEDNNILSASLRGRMEAIEERERAFISRNRKLDEKAKEIKNRESKATERLQEADLRLADARKEAALLEKEGSQLLEAIEERETGLRDRIRKVGHQEEANARLRQESEKAQKEASEAVRNAAASESATTKRESILLVRERDFEARSAELATEESSASERKGELDKREEKVGTAEADLKKSSAELSKAWAEFRKSVHEQNEKIGQDRKEIEVTKTANEDYARTLKEKADQQREKDKEIADRYATLKQSVDEFLTKQKQHGNGT